MAFPTNAAANVSARLLGELATRSSTSTSASGLPYLVRLRAKQAQPMSAGVTAGASVSTGAPGRARVWPLLPMSAACLRLLKECTQSRLFFPASSACGSHCHRVHMQKHVRLSFVVPSACSRCLLHHEPTVRQLVNVVRIWCHALYEGQIRADPIHGLFPRYLRPLPIGDVCLALLLQPRVLPSLYGAVFGIGAPSVARPSPKAPPIAMRTHGSKEHARGVREGSARKREGTSDTEQHIVIFGRNSPN